MSTTLRGGYLNNVSRGGVVREIKRKVSWWAHWEEDFLTTCQEEVFWGEITRKSSRWAQHWEKGFLTSYQEGASSREIKRKVPWWAHWEDGVSTTCQRGRSEEKFKEKILQNKSREVFLNDIRRSWEKSKERILKVHTDKRFSEGAQGEKGFLRCILRGWFPKVHTERRISFGASWDKGFFKCTLCERETTLWSNNRYAEVELKDGGANNAFEACKEEFRIAHTTRCISIAARE